jgi:peptidoglycan/LPS O-acetylase OafA/YrhL
LIAGSIIAFLFYRYDNPEYLIQWGSKDALRYLFFYQNYTGAPFHWIFDHVWSLCVEEHFYILLPLVIILVKGIFGNRKLLLFLSVTGLIIAGIVFKELSILYTHSKDTYAGTHNRIDALGWGVLLGVIISYYGDKCKTAKWRPPLFILGLILFAIDIYGILFFKNYFFEKVVFHSLAPFSFFLMIFGVYYYDFSKWKPIRFIAYYSYNWYLWHPLFV